MEDYEEKRMLEMMSLYALSQRIQVANEQKKKGTYKWIHEVPKTAEEILLEDYYSEVDDLLSEDTCDDNSFSLAIRCYGTKNKYEVYVNNCNDHLDEESRQQADDEYAEMVYCKERELKEERSERKERRAQRAAKNAEILAGRAERRREYIEIKRQLMKNQPESKEPVTRMNEHLRQSSPPAKKRKSRSPSKSNGCTALKNGKVCNEPVMEGSTTVCSLECKKIRRNFNQKITRNKGAAQKAACAIDT
jgi:hypothetical protein